MAAKKTQKKPKPKVVQKFRRGQRIRLPANKKEGWKEQFAKVSGYEGNGMYIVTIDDEFREDDYDDRIREVHQSNMRAITKK